MWLATIFLALFAIIPEGDTTTCYVQNSILNVLTQACPANVYQCMQFTCSVTSPKKFKQITKGCNDLNNPVVSCTTIMNNCQALGGVGRCYTCTGDYCNSSKIPIIFLSIIIPLFFFKTL
ncbi:unnamed protein product [Caenorhabditis angaria]|uniref:Uncharacterized protein n=1 Tax=Caenorhabditis angaria TaxID=860376 RepID=A0A9P1IWU9_9PELO|nr:unnamed protein product [Caenorhabditis angaria]